MEGTKARRLWRTMQPAQTVKRHGLLLEFESFWILRLRAGGEQPGRRLAPKPAKRMWSVEGSEKCDKEGRPWFTPRHRGMLLLDRSSYLSTATVVSALAHVAGRPLSSANRRCAGDGRVPLCQCGHRGRFTLCNMARTMAEKAMRRVATIST